MDRGAATQWPQVTRITTAHVPVADRSALVSDELGQRLTEGLARPLPDADSAPEIDWLNVDFGGGLVVADVRLAGLDVARPDTVARAGDDDCTLFVSLGSGVRFEQNDRRVDLAPGEAVFVAHGREVRSWYPGGNRMLLVRLPREVVSAHIAVEQAGGLRLAADREETELLRCYLSSVVRRAEAGTPSSPMTVRHICELVLSGVSTAVDPDRTVGLAEARVERMREYVARHFADPTLSMEQVARAADVSARLGYLLFEAAELNFTAMLIDTRLAHAREWLQRCPGAPPSVLEIASAVGFKDLSHFNRRFRLRYGCTPSDVRRAAASSNGARAASRRP